MYSNRYSNEWLPTITHSGKVQEISKCLNSQTKMNLIADRHILTLLYFNTVWLTLLMKMMMLMGICGITESYFQISLSHIWEVFQRCMHLKAPDLVSKHVQIVLSERQSLFWKIFSGSLKTLHNIFLGGALTSICHFFCLSVHLLVCLSVSLSVHLFTSPSVRLSIHPFVHLSICCAPYLRSCVSYDYNFCYNM